MVFHICCNSLHRALLLTTGVFLCTAFFLGWWRTSNQYARSPADTWVLVGGITNSSAEFRTLNGAELIVADNPQLLNPVWARTITQSTTGVPQAITIPDLEPATRYYYALNNALIGRFRTAPNPGTRWNFTVAMAGCADTGSKSAVFDRIRSKQPDLFVHLGDFHYENIDSDDLALRINAISTVLASEPQAMLYRSTSFVYIWDDHCWLGNDAAADTVEDIGAIETARESYTLSFPHYPLGSPANSTTSGVYHAFTLGTVRFVISDVRSETTAVSIFSDTQRDWLQEELSRAEEFDFLVWVTSKPWVGDIGSDAWSGFPEDRAMVSEWLSAVPSRNVLAVSADAHMLALDDGSHTFYGQTNGTANPVYSFPILQSGPLDRTGSAKGGPFTQQCSAVQLERNHQYSVLDFEFNEGEDPCLHIKSYRYADFGGESVVFERLFCGQLYGEAIIDQESSETPECSIPDVSVLSQGVFYSGASLLGLSLVLVLWRIRPCSQAIGVIVVSIVGWALTVAVAFGIPRIRGSANFDTQPALILGLLQSVADVVLVLSFVIGGKKKDQAQHEH